MKSYVWVTFALLGLGYYEMSGGADFKPGTQGPQVFAEVAPITPAELSVTRLAMIDMTSVAQTDSPVSPPDQMALKGAVLTALDQTEATIDNAGDQPERLASFVVNGVEADAPQEASGPDLRLVNASRVNLRNGPGQEFGVVAKLGSGTAVQVLEDPGDGWVHLRILPQGRMGWVADFLLDDA